MVLLYQHKASSIKMSPLKQKKRNEPIESFRVCWCGEDVESRNPLSDSLENPLSCYDTCWVDLSFLLRQRKFIHPCINTSSTSAFKVVCFFFCVVWRCACLHKGVVPYHQPWKCFSSLKHLTARTSSVPEWAKQISSRQMEIMNSQAFLKHSNENAFTALQ